MFDHLFLFGLLLFCANRTCVYGPIVYVLASLRRAAEPAERRKVQLAKTRTKRSYHIVSFSSFCDSCFLHIVIPVTTLHSSWFMLCRVCDRTCCVPPLPTLSKVRGCSLTKGGVSGYRLPTLPKKTYCYGMQGLADNGVTGRRFSRFSRNPLPKMYISPYVNELQLNE